MESLVEESDKRVPLVCFLSMGSDPTENIVALAKKMNCSKYLYPNHLLFTLSSALLHPLSSSLLYPLLSSLSLLSSHPLQSTILSPYPVLSTLYRCFYPPLFSLFTNTRM